MALTNPVSGSYRYADLAKFPDDHLRREIIDGDLIVTPSPIVRHQKAVGNIFFRLESYSRQSGGGAFVAPLDVYFADDNVVEPDVLFVGQGRSGQITGKYIKDAPDLVVEVSSPSNRRLELVRKRELYQRFGVPEYWYIDLEADRVEVYRLAVASYPPPELLYPGESLTSPNLVGFVMSVEEALAISALT